MKIKVELWAFADGKVRQVEILDRIWQLYVSGEISAEALLEEVFRMGQNEFQPQEMPSVSMGDVIVLDALNPARRFLVLVTGFVQMNNVTYDEHIHRSPLARALADMLDEASRRG
jgi:hypothetical protein